MNQKKSIKLPWYIENGSSCYTEYNKYMSYTFLYFYIYKIDIEPVYAWYRFWYSYHCIAYYLANSQICVSSFLTLIDASFNLNSTAFF